MKALRQAILSVVYPHRCVVCGRRLSLSSNYLCSFCNIKLPRTYLHLKVDNPLERLFWGEIEIDRASAFFYYQKGSDYRKLIYFMKYKGEKRLAEMLGKHFADELSASNFFEGIDLIMPVPLHPERLRERGYNQSEWIARGITYVANIPVDTTSVTRKIYTSTQTKKSSIERWENVQDMFEITNPEAFTGKHILLVDDVITTGSTLKACASVFKRVPNVRISIVVLGMVG